MYYGDWEYEEIGPHDRPGPHMLDGGLMILDYKLWKKKRKYKTTSTETHERIKNRPPVTVAKARVRYVGPRKDE